MFVIAKYQQLLQQLGLATLEQVKAFQGQLIKNHKGRRDILKISVPGHASRPLVLFLKRNWKPYKKDGLASFFSRGEAWSQSRVEWENSRALLRAGLRAAEPVAFGEECGLLWEKFSFLITAAAEGDQTVGEFLQSCRDRAQRRRVFDALAQEIRNLHDAGLASPDLFTRHLFLETGGGEPRFCFIDMARLDRRKNISAGRRARDLAALNVTAPLRFVTARERVRFLKIYGGGRRLAKLIAKRTEYLLKRRKFRDFRDATPA